VDAWIGDHGQLQFLPERVHSMLFPLLLPPQSREKAAMQGIVYVQVLPQSDPRAEVEGPSEQSPFADPSNHQPRVIAALKMSLSLLQLKQISFPWHVLAQNAISFSTKDVCVCGFLSQ
jgi:hypothetical protein